MTYPVDPLFIAAMGDGCENVLPQIGPDEERVVTFDFSSDLITGETLTGGPTTTFTTLAGTDPGPVNPLSGAPEYNSGTVTQVQQPVVGSGGTPGNAYLLKCVSATSNPEKVLERYAILNIRG